MPKKKAGKRPKYGEIVVVFWEDTHTRSEWLTEARARAWAKGNPYRVATVGHLLYRDKDCVAVAAARTCDEKPIQMDMMTRIPRGCIRSMVRLGRHPWPEE